MMIQTLIGLTAVSPWNGVLRGSFVASYANGGFSVSEAEADCPADGPVSAVH